MEVMEYGSTDKYLNQEQIFNHWGKLDLLQLCLQLSVSERAVSVMRILVTRMVEVVDRMLSSPP